MIDDAELVELGRELERGQRRAARLHRFIKHSATDWTVWSQAIEQSLSVVANIEGIPPTELEGLAVRYQAIRYRIWIDRGAIADETLRRSLRRFGRALDQIAKS